MFRLALMRKIPIGLIVTNNPRDLKNNDESKDECKSCCCFVAPSMTFEGAHTVSFFLLSAMDGLQVPALKRSQSCARKHPAELTGFVTVEIVMQKGQVTQHYSRVWKSGM